MPLNKETKPLVNPELLGNSEYFFIAIAPRSTLIRSGSTCLGSQLWVKYKYGNIYNTLNLLIACKQITDMKLN